MWHETFLHNVSSYRDINVDMIPIWGEREETDRLRLTDLGVELLGFQVCLPCPLPGNAKLFSYTRTNFYSH